MLDNYSWNDLEERQEAVNCEMSPVQIIEMQLPKKHEDAHDDENAISLLHRASIGRTYRSISTLIVTLSIIALLTVALIVMLLRRILLGVRGIVLIPIVWGSPIPIRVVTALCTLLLLPCHVRLVNTPNAATTDEIEGDDEKQACDDCKGVGE